MVIHMSRVEENIISRDFAEEMRNSYRDYAMSVIVSRALPDIRDGLKPVQRRILYAMKELSLEPQKPHRKSARIVGDTMGKYHPHGDSSIYDALVHMTEDYSLSIPLVDGHGNFGSIDGDGAAAMRYTEARLSEGAMMMLSGLDKDLVEFIPNFDESEKEPTVLPAMFPNLLINGTTGIAVGMATNIPPHNAGEVINGIIAYMDKPAITTEQLMHYILAPDFPTGGIITNSEVLKELYETGEGRIKIRARTTIEDGEYGRKNIIITEIPYTVAGNKSKLVESLVQLMKEKVFDEIYDVRDESSKEGIRIVIEVKKDRDIENLLNGLYKKTAMEDTYTVNLLAVKEKQPVTFHLKGMIEEFVHFQEKLYTREYEHLLQKAKTRLELVDGLIKATDIIDLIIEILRGSTSLKQAKECLIHGTTTDIQFKMLSSQKKAAKLDFTERQADAILAMPLSKLIGLEIVKLHEEHDTLLENISSYKKVLENKSELYQVIKTRLRSYKKVFARARRTTLESLKTIDYVEEFKEEDIYILIDKFGYTKSIDSTSYSRSAPETLSEYVSIIPMKNTDKLCIFTAQGKMYQLKAAAIPKGKIKEKGSLIQTLCKVDKEEILLYTSFETLFESQLLYMTKYGYIKLVSGAEFETVRQVISATKLEEGDEIVTVQLLSSDEVLDSNQKVILLTKKGLSLGFSLQEVSQMKKNGRGVKAIILEEDDYVVFAIVQQADKENFFYEGRKYHAKKVRNRQRGVKGQRAQL